MLVFFPVFAAIVAQPAAPCKHTEAVFALLLKFQRNVEQVVAVDGSIHMAPTTVVVIQFLVDITMHKGSGDRLLMLPVIEPHPANLPSKLRPEIKLVNHPNHLFEFFVVVLSLLDINAVGKPVFLC